MNLPRIRRHLLWATLPSGHRVRYTRLVMDRTDDPHDVSVEQKAQTATATTTFLLIPGNPGNDRFYDQFGECLLNQFASRGMANGAGAEFVAVAHANHAPIPSDGERERPQQERLNLEQQIELKLEFCLRVLADQKCCADQQQKRVYLIGHSIGVYIALRLLPVLMREQWNIVRCFGLFPTLEHMAQTPSGKRIGPVVKFVDQFDVLFRLFLFPALLLGVPHRLKLWLCRRFFLGPNSPANVAEAAAELAEPLVARNIAHMANHELQTVLEFDDSLVGEHHERVLLFYGQTDDWAPASQAETMRQRGPRVPTVLVDQGGMEHAFVIEHSAQMAELLAEWIENGNTQ